MLRSCEHVVLVYLAFWLTGTESLFMYSSSVVSMCFTSIWTDCSFKANHSGAYSEIKLMGGRFQIRDFRGGQKSSLWGGGGGVVQIRVFGDGLNQPFGREGKIYFTERCQKPNDD